MKRIFSFIITVSMFVIFIGCESSNLESDKGMAKQQEKLAKEANAELGFPSIINFSEKRTLKMIQELRDDPNLINYAYLFAENSGQLIYLGKCIGYGIPYATQYTNPDKLVYNTNGNIVLPQADPNGLFSPASADGTWLMLIDPSTNKPKAVLIEPKVIVSPFPLK